MYLEMYSILCLLPLLHFIMAFIQVALALSLYYQELFYPLRSPKNSQDHAEMFLPPANASICAGGGGKKNLHFADACQNPDT